MDRSVTRALRPGSLVRQTGLFVPNKRRIWAFVRRRR
jgi:hypothetical protein